MAGLAVISLQQRIDLNGRPYAGAKAYITSAESLAPLTTYQDYGLGTPHAYPVAANAYGVFPAIYLDEADEFYRLRVTTSGGVTIDDLVTLPIIGPTGGGGGAEVPVEAAAIFQTGDLKPRYGTGTHAGWVRANGRTIGSATSGASERANSDTEALFLYLWATDSTLSVSGGRGATAAADWAANKTMALPDWRGYALAALDDMGNAPAGRLTASYFGVAATTLGAAGGSEKQTHGIEHMPAHDHDGSPGGSITVALSDWTTTRSNTLTGGNTRLQVSGANGADEVGAPSSIGLNATVTDTLTIASEGGGVAHPTVGPTKLATIYIKL